MRCVRLCIIVFAVYSFFNNIGICYAQDQSTIDQMQAQLDTMQKMILQQQEQIRELTVKLDAQPEREKSIKTPDNRFVKEDSEELDRAVDERIKEYFESEESREVIASHMPLDMGYDKGFYLKTHDEKFSLKTAGMLQFRYIYEDNNRVEDSSSFRIRRGRLKFTGNAFDEHLKYVTQMELRSTGSKDDSKSVELLDFFGTYEKYEFAKIRFGQWKVPFNSQFMTSAGELQMIDRSEADEVFNLGRQLGVAVFGEVMHKKLEYFLGTWNGNFRNEKGNDNNQHLWIFRTAYSPFGHYGEAESDYEYSEKPLALIAGAVAFDNEEGKSLEVREIGKLETNDIDKTQIVGELGFKYKGFSFLGEYYWRKRHIDTFSGSIPEEGEVEARGLNDTNFIDRGFFAQAGYFLIPRRLEMTGRYSMVSFDDQLEEDSIIETTLGLNYYLAGRRNKLQFNAVRLDEDSHEDGKDAIDYKYLLQYQLSF